MAVSSVHTQCGHMHCCLFSGCEPFVVYHTSELCLQSVYGDWAAHDVRDQ